MLKCFFLSFLLLLCACKPSANQAITTSEPPISEKTSETHQSQTPLTNNDSTIAEKSQTNQRSSEYPITGDILAMIYGTDTKGNNQDDLRVKLNDGNEIGYLSEIRYTNDNDEYLTAFTFKSELSGYSSYSYKFVFHQITYKKNNNQWLLNSSEEVLNNDFIRRELLAPKEINYSPFFLKGQNNTDIFSIPSFTSTQQGLFTVEAILFSYASDVKKWFYVGAIPVATENSAACRDKRYILEKYCLKTEVQISLKSDSNPEEMPVLKVTGTRIEEHKDGKRIVTSIDEGLEFSEHSLKYEAGSEYTDLIYIKDGS